MAKFKYSALTATGEEVKGVARGETLHAVTTQLFDEGLDVQQVKEHKSALSFEITKEKVKPEQVMHFSRQMAAFIRAGVPLIDAIEIIQEENPDKTLRKVLGSVVDGLRRGETLSGAMSVHSDAFPPFYVSVLRSVELTGLLDNVLDRLSGYIERDLEARRKIKSALAYPTVIGLMSVIVVIILTVFVLPRFKTFFASFHAKLPLTTRMVLATTNFLTTWWWALVPAVGGVIIGLMVVGRTRGGKHLRDRVLLRIPKIGTVARYAVIERFCRILSSMVQAGVPLADAIQLASEGSNNTVYQDALVSVRESLLEGQGIAEPMARTQLFPGAVTQMIRVGETTGTLDDQLASTADFYGKELEYKLKNLTTLFEPAAIVMVGLMVGFVAVALVSAMYGIFRQVKV